MILFTFFWIALLLDWNKTFSGPVATAEFSKFADILSAASSFRILNSLAGILSPPLASYIVMLPRVQDVWL